MNIRVLMVEDDEYIAALVPRILKERESTAVTFEFEIATTALQCEEALTKILPPYDVVLLDLNLSDLKGIATFRRVHRQSRRIRIPIVVMTADQFVMDSEIIRNGAQDFIMKPITSWEMVSEKLHYAVLRYESIRETNDKYNGVLTGIRGMIDKLNELDQS